MTVFEEACLLSCEEWVDSFPSDLPKYKLSKQHKKKMKEILQETPNEDKYKLSKNTIKVLLIAAILLSIATTVFAIPASRDYVISKFFNHSSYNVTNIDKLSEVESLEMNYIPDGFIQTDEYNSINFYGISFSKKQEYFSVDKHTLNAYVGFDTEKYDCEDILINGITGVFFLTDNSEKGIILNNGKYIFIISGNIDKEELVNIAQNLN